MWRNSKQLPLLQVKQQHVVHRHHRPACRLLLMHQAALQKFNLSRCAASHDDLSR